MNNKGYDSFVTHLDATIAFFEQEQARISKHNGQFLIEFDLAKIQEAFTRAIVTVSRITGRVSTYMQDITSIRESKYNPDVQFRMILGTLRALRFDLEQGYLQTLEELAHGDLFSDYLDMASYLNVEGYFHAAAVIAGSTLEGHQRKLAGKNGIDITFTDRSGKEQSKKAQRLNQDLLQSGVYSANDHKLVTSLLAIRTSAAHGRYDEFTAEQVTNMISSIRELVNRLPA